MKISFPRSLILLLLCCPVLFPAVAAAAADNVITNPGFEDGITPWTTDTGWALDTGVSHNGSNSYRCTCSGTQSGVMRELSITPGGTYTLTGWLRTSGIGSGTRAAYISVDWYTNGVWTDEVCLSLYGSDTDTWQQFTPRTFSIPATATRVVMGLGTFSGVSGTIWFDDLELDSPISIYSQLRYPPYRETLLPGQERKLNIGVKATGNDACPLSGCSVVIDVENMLHESLLHRSETYDTGKDWCSYEYSLPSLVAGSSYTVTTRLVHNTSSTEVAAASHTLVVADTAAPLPKVYIDEYNRMVVDGRLFFPLGVYASTDCVSAYRQMDMMREAKLNAQLCTPSGRFTPEQGATYLNEAAQRGIKVIYNLAYCIDGDVYYPGFTPPSSFGSWSGTFGVLQGIVSTFKDYPALLAWYTDDEQDTDDVIAQLQRSYDFIRNSDNHPVVQVLVAHQNLQSHVPNTDILGTDYYPVYGSTYDFYKIGDDAAKTGVTVMRSKGIWSVIEAPVVETGQVRTATYEEILAQCYQAITHGSRGILFFIMTAVLNNADSAEHWQTMCRLGTHLDGLKDIALGVDAPADKVLSVSNSSVSVLTRVLENGDIYALAVNPYTTTANATFTIGSGISVSTYVPVGLPGAPERQVTVNGGRFTDNLEALGTRVYRLHRASVPDGDGNTDSGPAGTGRPVAYPSVVTPNHDGKNDLLHIRYTCAPGESMTLKLFDLSGMLVYERTLEGEHALGNNEYLAAWDGSDLSGSPVPQGLYLVTLFKGDKTYYKRLVQVLR